MSDWNRGGRDDDRRRYGERSRDEARTAPRPERGGQQYERRSFDFERDWVDPEHGGYTGESSGGPDQTRGGRDVRGAPYPGAGGADEDGREGFDRYGVRGEKDYRGEVYRTRDPAPSRTRGPEEGEAAYGRGGGIVGENPALERVAFGEADQPWRHELGHGEGRHRGRVPKNYTRSDERVREDVSERLCDDPWLDASEIEVLVQVCEVTLAGSVRSRPDKHRAEHLAEAVSGVRHVQNNLRIQPADGEGETAGGLEAPR